MPRLLLTLVLLVLFCSPALAGKNAGGALVVHTEEINNPYWPPPPDYCEILGNLPMEHCEDLVHQSNFVDPNFLLGALVFFFVALPEDSSPGVSVIYFGIEHNFSPGFIAGWSLCGPPNSLEIPDAGWPEDWENAGNAVAFGSPITNDHLFGYYWLGVYGDAGNFIGTGINPTGGYAAFVSDDDPGVLDETDLFGQLRWFEPGYNQCPGSGAQACCYPNGTCELLLPSDCIAAGGTPVGSDTCDPNPCPEPEPEACCFPDGSCEFLLVDPCVDAGGIPQGEGTDCDPNRCPQPPTAACCFIDGSCEVLLLDVCEDEGGIPQEEGSDCDPNPCPQLERVCCISDFCFIMTEDQCQSNDGLWFPDEESCEGFDCPPVAIEEATWGSIKANYR